MKTVRVFKLVLILIFSLSLTYSQEISFKGFGAAGYRFYDRDILNQYNQEAYYEGKFQADIKVNKDIEAQLDFRGNSSDNEVTLREFSVKFEYIDRLKFKFGNLKKPFGLDQTENREDLAYIERSMATNRLEDIGYGGRALSFMAYYKYSKKNPDYPYSYYMSVFRNNSMQTGLAGRFAYHVNDWAYGVNYLLIHSSNKKTMLGNGIGLDVSYEDDNQFANLEATFAKDVEESAIRSWNGEEVSINAFGIKSAYGIKFDTGKDIIKKIEPFILVSLFLPELDESGNQKIQTLLGANFYFHKKVRLRVNADLRLTKNQYVDEYTTKESRGVIEVQVRF